MKNKKKNKKGNPIRIHWGLLFSNHFVGRTTISSVATEVDVDRAIATQQIQALSSATPYDLHVQGESIFNRGELERITNDLKTILEEAKFTVSIDFGREQRIDPALLKKIVERLNIQTQRDPNAIILDDLIILEPALVASKEKFFHFLNQTTSPIQVSQVDLDDDLLFLSTLVKPIIVKSLPKAIKDGVVKGTLEKDLFVPEAHTLQLQKNQVIALEKNGIIQIAQLEKVGIKDVDQYLRDHVDVTNPFMALEGHVILQSYVSNISTEVVQTIKRDNFVELNSVTFLAVGSESPDRVTISKLYLPLVYETSEIPVEPVYLQEVDKKSKKNALPNYLVAKSLESEIKTSLQEQLATSTAISDALQATQTSPEIISEPIADDESLKTSVLSKVVPKFDEKVISAYLVKQFSLAQTADDGVVVVDVDHKQVPAQLLRYYANTLGPELKDLYEQKAITEVKRIYNEAQLSSYILLLVNIEGIRDVATTNKKLASKIYADLQQSIATRTGAVAQYVPREAATKEMDDLVTDITSEIGKLTESDPGFVLSEALSQRQDRLIKGLEQELKSVVEVERAAYVAHLSTVVIHSKVLRLDGKYGLLGVTGKYIPRIMKHLDTKVNTPELVLLLAALKRNAVTQELIDEAKNIALGL